MSYSDDTQSCEGAGLSTPVGSRRTFFHWVTVAAAAVVGVGLAVPLLGSLVSPAFMRRKQAQGEVKVFSPICTHLGCGYRWDDTEKKFLCPCHGSAYDINGQVLGGPAPRPLDVLPSKVEGGRLLVMYQDFKSGLPQSVEL